MSDQGAGPGAGGGAQRAWRAACTFCGAPVEFRSAASPLAVCSFCKSTLVRDGESLRRIGQSAALFDDHSPLALGARGQHQGEAFTLIGRLQRAYKDDAGEEGRWTEWHALFDNGRSGALSEDNGAYVMSFALQPSQALPLRELMQAAIGQSVVIDSRPWVLSSCVQAHTHAAEGELAVKPDFTREFPVLELRNTAGEVLSIEPEAQPVQLDVGRSVQLADLRLSGIPDAKQVAEGKLQAKGIECPHCGTSLTPTLDSAQSIVCTSCKSVIDISKGLGSDLAYYRQDNTLEPLIPLGKVGTLKVGGKAENWQVVGYQERCDVPEDAHEEQTFWREYLLYNRLQGFAFLVDAEDGWSIVRPVTGVPAMKGDTLVYQGKTYRKRYTYPAKTTYVLGEFYWPVRKEQRTLNTDFAGQGSNSSLRLNREQTGNEVTWSAGETIEAQAVMSAFQIAKQSMGAFKRDATPMSAESKKWLTQLMWILLFLFIVILLEKCSDDCSDIRSNYGEYSTEYQQCRASQGSGSSSHGGSYGGYNSGGFHK
ncbi:MAG: DUF4178 domain-containing protein [Aquabacterium sp.]|uniref:DUF4178 domain-containing protein n=1 Tax=Aquabacterium sp. TaxID=1872578 RepID=UPI0025B891BC|nr:DUF4178 domain-containing protein [Aquabacterium sp.]MBI3381283.1 DUF4178 domain-containing protein [Aquabacterium sp.]